MAVDAAARGEVEPPERLIEPIRRRFARAGFALELARTGAGDWQARWFRASDRRMAGALVGATKLAVAEVALSLLEHPRQPE